MTCRFPTLMLLLAVSVQAIADDWPTYLRENSRRGFTPESLTFPLTSKWEFNSAVAPEKAWGAGPGERVIEGKDLEHRITFDDAFHVAVVDDRAYFGSSVDHQIRCVDAKTGGEIWHVFTGGPVRLAPTVFKGRVYCGSDDGFVYCLNASDGAELWKLRAGPRDDRLLARGDMISRWPIRTGVLIEDGIAYFGAGVIPHENIYMYAVNADDGSIVWKRDNISQGDAGRNDLSPQGYLLAEDSMLFVPSGRSLPAGFNRMTGEVLHKRIHSWRRDAGGVVGGTQAMLSDGQLYSWGAQHILALDQQSGDVGYGWFDGQQMAVAGDAAYVANGQIIAKLDREEYAVNSRRRHKLEAQVYQLSRDIRGKQGQEKAEIEAKIESAELELKKISDVGFVWKADADQFASLVVAGDVLLAGGNGDVVALDTTNGTELWSATVDGEARGLAISNGRLFVSTTTGQITCFGSPDSAAGSQKAANGVAEASGEWPKDSFTQLYEDSAKQILEHVDVDAGFCFVVGSEEGRLAWEIAKRSELKVFGIEPDAEKVARSRQRLSDLGVYGSRITIHHADLSPVPYSSYFANLIVSDTLLVSGTIPAIASEVARHVRPLGGKIVLGHPDSTRLVPEARGWLEATDLDDQASIDETGNWVTLTRGKLPGAGSWTHQYGEPGNTACSDDQLVKGGLGVLWYGDPGESKIINRHEGAVGPLSANGRLFIQGQSTIMAYDAYNGQFLWEIENPESVRTGVFQNQNPGNLVISDDSLFFMTGDRCVQLDAVTGKRVADHLLPEGPRRETHQWGYVAYQDGILFGTATIREEIDERLRRRGRATRDSTDSVFAIDVDAQKHLWEYQGSSIAHHTIAIGPKHVYCIDSTITSDERAAILRQDKTELAKLTGEAQKIAEARLKRADLRTVVALEARSGKKIWSKAVDVTDCSEIGIGGGQLTLMHHNDVLVICGANANGHYWKQFIAGEFKLRRLVALAAADGRKLWSKDGNYRHRPIIVGEDIIAEPWSFDLYTGDQRTRENPLTGKEEPWSMIRSGHHCGMLSAAPNMLFFRAGYTGFYDLESDAGTQHFAGHRTGCWINMIPANGLLMIPESSAGCVCLFSVMSTIVMEPRAEERRPWAIYSSTGDVMPVKHMALNFGAPGDRRDARGRVWLSYPRPRPSKETGLDLALDLKPEFYDGGGYVVPDSYSTPIDGTETPWISSSYARGIRKLRIPLRNGAKEAATYKVELHFAEMNSAIETGHRKFDVHLQGKPVLKDVDILAKSGNAERAVTFEASASNVLDEMEIEFVAAADSPGKSRMPVLSGLVLERTE